MVDATVATGSVFSSIVLELLGLLFGLVLGILAVEKVTKDETRESIETVFFFIEIQQCS